MAPPAASNPADVFLPEDPLGEIAIVPPGDTTDANEGPAAEQRVARVFDEELPTGRADWSAGDAGSVDSPSAPRIKPAVLFGGIAAVAVAVLALWTYTREPAATDPAASSAAVSTPNADGGTGMPRQPEAPTRQPEAGAPAAAPASGGPSSAPAKPAGGSAASATGGASTTAAPADVTVVRADVCRNFSPSGEWRCEPVEGSVGPSRLVFYTRVRSASPLAVEHRWYHGSDLVQRVPLRIGANPGAGYRTFSRQTVAAARTGEWRAELRASDGSLLAEVRFDVR